MSRKCHLFLDQNLTVFKKSRDRCSNKLLHWAKLDSMLCILWMVILNGSIKLYNYLVIKVETDDFKDRAILSVKYLLNMYNRVTLFYKSIALAFKWKSPESLKTKTANCSDECLTNQYLLSYLSEWNMKKENFHYWKLIAINGTAITEICLT